MAHVIQGGLGGDQHGVLLQGRPELAVDAGSHLQWWTHVAITLHTEPAGPLTETKKSEQPCSENDGFVQDERLWERFS